MIVIGIDPSLRGTGLCRLTDGKLLDKTKDLAKITTRPEGKQLKERIHRCREIVSQIETFSCLNKDVFTLFVIEGYAFGAQGQTFSIGESGGLIRDWLLKTQEQFKTDMMEIGPGQLKKFITGKGNSPKDIMIKEVFKNFGFDTNDNDIADAFGLSYMAWYYYNIKNKTGVKVKVNADQKKMIDEMLKLESSRRLDKLMKEKK